MLFFGAKRERAGLGMRNGMGMGIGIGRMWTLTVLCLLALLLLLPSVHSTPSPSSPLVRRSSLHLCKCTCFSTNSSVVPLYSPLDASKPCLTCTRQFCLDQGLEICRGARIERPDEDTGTGWEGEVWAKCFRRDSYKDQTIVSLYLLTVLGLLAIAALRGRVGGWYEDLRQTGPGGLYRAMSGSAARWR